MFLRIQHLRCGSRSGVEAFEADDPLVDVDFLQLRGLSANKRFKTSSISELKWVRFYMPWLRNQLEAQHQPMRA